MVEFAIRPKSKYFACVKFAFRYKRLNTSSEISKLIQRMAFIESCELNANNYINGSASIIHTLQLQFYFLLSVGWQQTKLLQIYISDLWTFIRPLNIASKIKKKLKILYCNIFLHGCVRV